MVALQVAIVASLAALAMGSSPGTAGFPAEGARRTPQVSGVQECAIDESQVTYDVVSLRKTPCNRPQDTILRQLHTLDFVSVIHATGTRKKGCGYWYQKVSLREGCNNIGTECKNVIDGWVHEDAINCDWQDKFLGSGPSPY